MNNLPRQVIIMRRQFPNSVKMRRGKEIAQGSHASQAATMRAAELHGMVHNEAYHLWINGPFTKIVVYVNTEEELLKVYADAQAAGLPSALITDKGLTEFSGVPTNTAVGVGPAFPEQLALVTGHLPLY